MKNEMGDNPEKPDDDSFNINWEDRFKSTFPDALQKHLDGVTDETTETTFNDQNDFPYDVLPLTVQQYIIEAHQHLNYPIDYMAAAVLYTASVAIGNSFRAQLKSGFEENAVLYMALVGKPGINKSHPLSFALEPIMKRDAKNHKEYELKKKEYDRVINLSRKERKQQSIFEDPAKPTWKKHIVTDFTPEALIEVHKFNQRGIGVYVDELAGWIKNFNRYNRGSAMEFWLSTWNSKQIRIDRKTGDPIFINLPFISVGGTIQTALLKELAKEGRNHNGFLDRLLFVLPLNLKKPYWAVTDISQETIASWSNIVNEILNLPLQFDENNSPLPKAVKFSIEAKEKLFKWQQTNADLCNDSDDDMISGIYSKLEMYAIRFSLIIEVLQSVCEKRNITEINTTSVDGAIKLVEYFQKTAVRVQSIIAGTGSEELLPQAKKDLFNLLPDTFTKEEAMVISEPFAKPRTLSRFLNNKALFIRVDHGIYQKVQS